MLSPVGLLRLADDVLRGNTTRGAPTRDRPARLLGSLTVAIVVFGMFYGSVMGTYGGIAGSRIWQVVYSAVKVPILLFATFLLSMPSFFVVNTLLGLRSDFPRAVRAIISTQAGLTAILAALAPITAFWYVSGIPYEPAILFNGVMFGVASLGAQSMLRRSYEPLVRANPKHRWMLRVWLVIYVFVGIQMAWVLRPFIGDPLSPTEFFRQGAWTNAYEVVIKMNLDVLSGRVR